MTFHGNFRNCQFSHLNPFDTMKFQYFALISTGMRDTHVHLSIMTLIYGLNLNNRLGVMALWCEFTVDYLDPIYNFTLMSHDLKVNFLGAKIVENLAFL